MRDITINYEHLSKSEAINTYLQEKISKLEKFLQDGSKITINIIDNTPNKHRTNPEYKVIIDVRNIVHGKNIITNITHKTKDLYSGIDTVVDKINEKLRRNHEKSSSHFKNFKQKLFQNYANATTNKIE